MKELSIEQKAKAYDELKVKASRIYNKENDVLIMHTLEDLFPELKESEDERIRKELLNYFEHYGSTHCQGVKVADILVWLEKQDKQKPVISYDALREGIAYFEITQYQIDNWLKKYIDVEKQGEQNEQIFWEKCNHCEYFDGYDICLHEKNFGSVTNESKENCKNNKFYFEKKKEQQ